MRKKFVLRNIDKITSTSYTKLLFVSFKAPKLRIVTLFKGLATPKKQIRTSRSVGIIWSTFLSLFVFMSVWCCPETHAQYLPPTFAVHITSPWGFVDKSGVKFEYRIYSENALLLSYTDYYGLFPGFQTALEYRIYYPAKGVVENIIYTKIGTGFADYKTTSLYTVSSTDVNKAPGTYYFGGAGVGKHFNFSHFFFELTAGLKFSYVVKPPAQYNQQLFYSIGPGSIPDINLHFGYQF